MRGLVFLEREEEQLFARDEEEEGFSEEVSGCKLGSLVVSEWEALDMAAGADFTTSAPDSLVEICEF